MSFFDFLGKNTDKEIIETLQNELEGQLKCLHESAIVSETDVQGNITFVNDTFCKISGYSREELIGNNHRMLKSGRQSDTIFEDLWKTISSGKIWSGEVCNKKKDGGYYWVKSTIVPIAGKDGKPAKYVSVRFDITEQKLMYEDLREHMEELASHEEELKQTFEELAVTNEQLMSVQADLKSQVMAINNAAIVSVTDVQGNIIYVNDMFCTISGYTKDELIGKNHRMLKSGKQPDAIFDDLWKTISSGKVWRGLVLNKAKDGSFYWVHSVITPVIGEDGKPVRYIAIRVDITKWMETNQALAKAEKNVAALTSNLEAAVELLEKKLIKTEGDLGESLRYAARIQKTLLPTFKEVRDAVPNNYDVHVYNHPRDMIGGDFYWAGTVGSKSCLFFADAAGHGVPGAILSIIGLNLVQKLIMERALIMPSMFLQEFSKEYSERLRQNDSNNEFNVLDTLEGILLTFDKENIFLASANRPSVIVRKGQIIELEYTKRFIGGNESGNIEKSFKLTDVDMQSGDYLFLFSDGFQSQISGTEGRIMGKSMFYNLLSEATFQPDDKMFVFLQKKLDEWKGPFQSQTDDICIICIRKQ